MADVWTNVGKALVTKMINPSTRPAPGTDDIKYIGWGTGAGTSQVTDTELFAEATESRVAGTMTRETITVSNDTYQVVGTMTCAGASKTITNAGVFDSPTAGNLWQKSDFAGVELNVGDSIAFTFQVKFTQ